MAMFTTVFLLAFWATEPLSEVPQRFTSGLSFHDHVWNGLCEDSVACSPRTHVPHVNLPRRLAASLIQNDRAPNSAHPIYEPCVRVRYDYADRSVVRVKNPDVAFSIYDSSKIASFAFGERPDCIGRLWSSVATNKRQRMPGILSSVSPRVSTDLGLLTTAALANTDRDISWSLAFPLIATGVMTFEILRNSCSVAHGWFSNAPPTSTSAKWHLHYGLSITRFALYGNNNGACVTAHDLNA